MIGDKMKCKNCKEELTKLNYEIKKIESGIYEDGNLNTINENYEGEEFNFYCPYCDEILASSMSDGKAIMKKIIHDQTRPARNTKKKIKMR